MNYQLDSTIELLQILTKMLTDESSKEKECKSSFSSKKSNDILTLKEAASYLDLKPSTIYSYVSKGVLSSYKPNGGKLYFLVGDLQQFILNKKYYKKSKDMLESEIISRFYF